MLVLADLIPTAPCRTIGRCVNVTKVTKGIHSLDVAKVEILVFYKEYRNVSFQRFNLTLDWTRSSNTSPFFTRSNWSWWRHILWSKRLFVFSTVTFPVPLPCDPSPCGANAICKERNGAGSCSCLPDYTGDPYQGCRPECVQNSDCVHTKACINNKCKDPCVGACGINAQCQVINHQPSCSCLSGYTGDPLKSCHISPGKFTK